MSETRWTNPSLPQTLQIAVFLLYIEAFFDALSLVALGIFPLLGVAMVVGRVYGGWGIANEQRTGYNVALVAAVAPIGIRFYYGGLDAIVGASILSLMIDIALIALLLHPMSREYQKIWFR